MKLPNFATMTEEQIQKWSEEQRPFFEKMSTEELEEWRTQTKQEQIALKFKMQASNAIWKERIEAERYADLVKAMNLPEGTRIIVPTGQLGIEGH